MKFSAQKTGHLGLSLVLSVLASACNPEEYYALEEILGGDDGYCYQAKDLNSCQALADRCQPAFTESENPDGEPEFALCIAKPNNDPSDGSTSGSSDGSGEAGSTDGSSTSGSTDGSVTAGSSTGSSTSGSTDGSATAGSSTGSSTSGSTDGSATAGSSTGSSTGGSTDGSATAGSNTGSVQGGSSSPIGAPTVEEAYNTNCANLDEKYMWIKTDVQKGKVKSVTKKVKLCHMSGNSGSHSIVVACQALKAHISHDDYLGACEF